MTQFIEITTKDNKKELVNTSIIEKIFVSKSKTYLKFSVDNAQGATGMEIKEDYEAVKRQLFKQK
ncbi:MAG TPA: hypothetical protein VK588_10415 [Chitinophagaceae bacterium]|nr:hypothetical protein [Chitinophagaceae bacterium]